MSKLQPQPGLSGGLASWSSLGLVGVISGLFLLVMEWLFFATKPSFLSPLGWWHRAEVLVTATTPVVIAVLLWSFAGWMIGCTGVRLLGNRWVVLGKVLVLALPTLITTAAFLLAIDNFTYTLFGFGVRTMAGVGRILYSVLLLVLLILAWRLVNAVSSHKWLQSWPGLVWLAVAMVIGLSGWNSIDRFVLATPFTAEAPARRPNIVMIGVDGLLADHLSVYGYHRTTTPNLDRFREDFLIAQNNFTNGAQTASSLISTLTGKLPSETGVVYPPNILRGEAAYQHLPGILRRLGYRSLDASVRHYADPFDLNLLEGFDSANGRSANRRTPTWLLRLGSSGYLLAKVIERVSERLEAVFLNRPMDRAFTEVTRGDNVSSSDRARLASALSFIGQTAEPYFVHLHFMGLHGPRFRPKQPHFSLGKEQRDRWMTDFYDDAVLDFDRQAGRLLEALQERQQLERTLIIIKSDHGQSNATSQRLPLLWRFPQRELAGMIKENTQNLDIGATVVDYLGLEQPAWMGGRSLISSRLEPLMPILAAGRIAGTVVTADGAEVDEKKIVPPFFTLGSLTVIFCQQAYWVNLETRIMWNRQVSGHTAPCDEVPGPEAAFTVMVEHLGKTGYDVSSLSDFQLQASDFVF